MTLPSKRRSVGNAAFFGLAAVVIAVVAWQAGRATERNAARKAEGAPPEVTVSIPETAPHPAAGEERLPPAPEASEPPPEAAESEATFVIPVIEIDARPSPPPAPPTEVPYRAPESRPADTPARCIMLQASPSTASAYGLSGEVVQLVVRAQNGCSTNFGSASFRAIAIGPDGREVASAAGSFSGMMIPAGGSAETLVAIPTKPGTALTFRAEITGY